MIRSLNEIMANGIMFAENFNIHGEEEAFNWLYKENMEKEDHRRMLAYVFHHYPGVQWQTLSRFKKENLLPEIGLKKFNLTRPKNKSEKLTLLAAAQIAAHFIKKSCLIKNDERNHWPLLQYIVSKPHNYKLYDIKNPDEVPENSLIKPINKRIKAARKEAVRKEAERKAKTYIGRNGVLYSLEEIDEMQKSDYKGKYSDEYGNINSFFTKIEDHNKLQVNKLRSLAH